MKIGEAIYKYATLSAPIAALVGTRVYPGFAPQDAAYPLIEYQISTRNRAKSVSGGLRLRDVDFELLCWAALPDDARALGDAVAARSADAGFHEFRGSMYGVPVALCTAENDDDELEVRPGADQQTKFGARVVLHLLYKD